MFGYVGTLRTKGEVKGEVKDLQTSGERQAKSGTAVLLRKKLVRLLWQGTGKLQIDWPFKPFYRFQLF